MVFFARMCSADGRSWEQREGSPIVQLDASACMMASRSTGPVAEVTAIVAAVRLSRVVECFALE